jgi:hypothetical protein
MGTEPPPNFFQFLPGSVLIDPAADDFLRITQIYQNSGILTEHVIQSSGAGHSPLVKLTPSGLYGQKRGMLSLNWNRRYGFFFRCAADRPIFRVYHAVIKRSSTVPAVLALLFMATQAHAGEIEPRAYVNTPVGINFLLAGYAFSDGGLSTSGASPIKDAQLRMHTEIFAYARTLDVWGKSGKFDVILPYAQLSGSAMVAGQPRERDVSGLNDPRFRFSVNFYGAPALSLEEFANYRQDLIIGASVQVSAPVGQYEKDKLVNLGNNRWFVKPDIGISKAWGGLTLELSTGVFFFSANDEYFGGRTLEQDPVCTTQVHATYSLGRGIWAALSWTYDYGGHTTIGGVRSDDLQNNSRWGATLAFPVNRNNSIKLYASTGVRTSAGTDFDLVGIIWQYRWGRGL